MRSRPIFLVALCWLLGVALLAGCGGESDTSGGAAVEETQTAEESPADTDATESAPADTGATAEASGEPIVIGIASGLSGVYSFADVPVADGVKMAVEDVNKEGGILGRPVEVVTSDTQSDPQKGVQAALDVLSKGADFIVPMCDYNYGLPAAQTALQQETIAYTCAGSPLWGPEGAGPLAFSVNAGVQTEGATAAQFAYDQGWRRAYQLEDTSTDYTQSWCSSFAEVFKGLGGEVVGKDTYVMGDTSVSAQVGRMSGTNPDVIALCGFLPTAATAVKEIRADGIDVPIVATAGLAGPEWTEAVPGVSDVYALDIGSLYGDDPNPEVNEFFKRYAEETGAPARLAYALYGYAIVQALKTASELAGTTEGPAVADALQTFSDEQLIVGPTTYSATCHVSAGRGFEIIGFQNGKGSYQATVVPSSVPSASGC